MQAWLPSKWKDDRMRDIDLLVVETGDGVVDTGGEADARQVGSDGQGLELKLLSNYLSIFEATDLARPVFLNSKGVQVQ